MASNEATAMGLMLKGLVSDLTEEQKQLFDQYIEKLKNEEASEDERGALLLAVMKFTIELQSIEGIQ